MLCPALCSPFLFLSHGKIIIRLKDEVQGFKFKNKTCSQLLAGRHRLISGSIVKLLNVSQNGGQKRRSLEGGQRFKRPDTLHRHISA